MSTSNLSPLESTELVRRWLLPYFARGLLYRWSPSIWLEQPAGKVAARRDFVPFLFHDLEQQAYDFEMPDVGDVEKLDALRQRHGADLLYADVLGRTNLVVFDPVAIDDILSRSPNPFGPGATKVGGLNHFQPDSLAISTGKSWKERRSVNEETLLRPLSIHAQVKQFLDIVHTELDRELATGEPDIGWRFMRAVAERITVQVVFGKAEDEEVLEHQRGILRHLETLMRQANLTSLVPELNRAHPMAGPLVRSAGARGYEGLYDGIEGYLRDPLPNSLIERLKSCRPDQPTWLEQQVPHWLFAMNEGIALHTLAALRLLASHPYQLRNVEAELKGKNLHSARVVDRDLGRLERCILEAMRLWTAVPLLGRSTREACTLETSNGAVELDPHTQILIINSYCNRDTLLTKNAHDFRPERWTGDRRLNARSNLVSRHFGGGAQRCPGAGLALLLIKTMTARLLREKQAATGIKALAIGRFMKPEPMPFSFDQFRIRDPNPTTRVPKPEPTKEVDFGTPRKDKEYDFIVVGSGAGGGPLAVNLAEKGWQVLLLEAGPDPVSVSTETTNKYRIPAFHTLASEDSHLRWDFFVDGDRKRHYPRGRALGGSTAVNALITVRAPNSDWDRMAELTGDKSWNATSMRKHFDEVVSREYLGHDKGWLNVELPNTLDVLLALRLDPAIRDILLSATGLMVRRTAKNLAAERKRLVARALAAVKAVSPDAERSLRTFQKVAPAASLAPVLMLLRLLQRDINDQDSDCVSQEGLFLVPASTRNRARDGSRERIARFVGESAPGSSNLTVKTSALVTRVELTRDVETKQQRAVGVAYVAQKRGYSPLYRADRRVGRGEPRAECERNVDEIRVRARREVILCAGTFNTPQILMLSGIGPKEVEGHPRDGDAGRWMKGSATKSEETGVGAGTIAGTNGEVPCKVELPGVGRNLQDRYEYSVVNEIDTDELAVLDGATFDPGGNDAVHGQWREAGRGLYASKGIAVGLVLRSRHVSKGDPADLFLFGAPTEFTGYEVGYSKNLQTARNKFTWAILKARTGNVGSVSLSSSCPFDPPRIDFQNFDGESEQDRRDLEALMEAVAYIRGMMRTGQVARHGVKEISPVVEGRELADDIRARAWGHHACGTCKMGTQDDPEAVVDSEFNVYGVKNLRVVDASVFPRIPGFFIVLPVYMLSEKASTIILKQVGQAPGTFSWTPPRATVNATAESV